ncbi:MAG: 8-oxoguanine deaminase [Alphaproteobacteria bacterium]|nr:8-oxoguanine deaminase [Alphaproteobacteria bacterium]
MTTWIKNPLAILADGAAGGVVIDGAEIVELVAAGAAPRTAIDTVFDASQHVVLPGLINTHHHFYQTLTRAHPEALDKELFPWLLAHYPVWARMTPESVRVAVRMAMVELMLSGCTTTSDHHYVFPRHIGDAIDIAVDEARRLGMRVVLTRGSMDLSEKDGGLPPDEVVQPAEIILADSERLIKAHHETGPGAMVQIALAPCTPFTASRELMRDTAELGRRLGVRLHTHLAETEDENAYCLEHFGHRPLDYLDSVGWLADDVWLAHGVFFNSDERKRLGAAGTGICHCPSSNMILASGFCPVPDLEAEGCAVGLGVDGSASNNCSNLIQEVRQALLLQRVARRDPTISHRDALRWATRGSAACLGRTDIGEIAVGKQADLGLYRLDDLRFSGHGDALAALILSGAHGVDQLMIAGQWRVVDGAIPGFDVGQLRAQHQDAAARLAAPS